jgi:hypothetical protein
MTTKLTNLLCHQHFLRHRKASGLQTIVINAGRHGATGIVAAIPDGGVIVGGLLRVDQLAHFLAEHVVNRQAQLHGMFIAPRVSRPVLEFCCEYFCIPIFIFSKKPFCVFMSSLRTVATGSCRQSKKCDFSRKNEEKACLRAILSLS